MHAKGNRFCLESFALIEGAGQAQNGAFSLFGEVRKGENFVDRANSMRKGNI